VLNQTSENLGRLGLQADELAVAAKLAVCRAEFENPESIAICSHVNDRDCRTNTSARQNKRPIALSTCARRVFDFFFPLLIDRSACIIPVSN